MRLCVDTSAYSRFKGGDAPVVQHLDSAAWIGVPTVVLGELEAGFRLGRHRERNLDELERFLSHPSVDVVVVDRDVARLYGEIVIDLRRRGTPLPTNDVWIAACAARTAATLLTYGRHFATVDRIGVLLLDG
jgi:tRNA(fMet)-specific endonuclease VapC